MNNWRHDNQLSWMIISKRSQAKKKNIEFNLSVNDITIPDICPVLGIKLIRSVGKGQGSKYNSPSLDRIDNSLGYVKGNVRVISQRANRLKSDASLEELEKIVLYMKGEK